MNDIVFASTLTGPYLGKLLPKQVGTQNWKCPNRDIKFSISQNDWQKLNMFKAAEVERKILKKLRRKLATNAENALCYRCFSKKMTKIYRTAILTNFF